MDRFMLYLLIFGYIQIIKTNSPNDIINETKKKVVSTRFWIIMESTMASVVNTTKDILIIFNKFSFLIKLNFNNKSWTKEAFEENK